MGRNNNGSLFHQLINAPGLMERQDLSQPVSFQTKENYCNWCHKAADIFKSYGIRLHRAGQEPEIPQGVVQRDCNAVASAQQEASRPSRTTEFFRQAVCSAWQKQGFSDQAGPTVDS